MADRRDAQGLRIGGCRRRPDHLAVDGDGLRGVVLMLPEPCFYDFIEGLWLRSANGSP
ncbi:MAG: hypothetical protein J6386_07605 [Candidatus Synoicihabitans palmerolidicus]|nr:hypothetical protein [Candidatus Synoicihabitans palmerolidicus]